MNMPFYRRGFTLVELAIVITIIGLLIGGVLKGQELLENARMTAAQSQIKGYTAAFYTFRDIYKSLPGDIDQPSAFVPDCSASPCNVPGNRDGIIGLPHQWVQNEKNNFWLHLAKAGLITGVNLNATWDTSVQVFKTAEPAYKMGGTVNVTYYNAVNATFPEGIIGHYLIPFQPTADGSSYDTIMNIKQIGKLDLKVDDGKPWSGELVLLRNYCGVADGAQAYDPNGTGGCLYGHRSGI